MSAAGDDLDAMVAERLAAVRERIANAGGVGVSVLPVTKLFSIDHCRAAHRAGCSAVGENYAQEVVAKFAGERPLFAVHFIGQLQTNKVRLLAPLIDVYESVDRASLVAELAKRVPGAAVLLQVACADEPGKGGCALAAVPALLETAVSAGLDVRGLMTVGPTVGGPEAARAGFRAVRSLCDRLRLAVCSMGMTDDLEVGVQEGSTQVRVGSALFGERPVSAGSVR
ncbi:MAG: YggS family pyridoxal phosphate enzyme [Actinomycetota bacterium]|nr:YggS family pyridoxal phosphate enzyme [Actinomycetota bacterium]